MNHLTSKKPDYIQSRIKFLTFLSLLLFLLIILFVFCLTTLFNNYSPSTFKTRIFSKKENGFIFSLLQTLETKEQIGLISIKYHEKGGAILSGVIKGLKAGKKHGLLILENLNSLILKEDSQNSSTNYFSLNNFHFNPTKSIVHSCKNTDKNGHMGDLGNVIANEDGKAEISVFFPNLKMELLFGRPVVLLKKEDSCEDDRIEESWDDVLAVGILGVESINEEENAIYEEIEKRLVEKKDLDVEFMEKIRKNKDIREYYEPNDEMKNKKLLGSIVVRTDKINNFDVKSLLMMNSSAVAGNGLLLEKKEMDEKQNKEGVTFLNNSKQEDVPSFNNLKHLAHEKPNEIHKNDNLKDLAQEKPNEIHKNDRNLTMNNTIDLIGKPVDLIKNITNVSSFNDLNLKNNEILSFEKPIDLKQNFTNVSSLSLTDLNHSSKPLELIHDIVNVPSSLALLNITTSTNNTPEIIKNNQISSNLTPSNSFFPTSIFDSKTPSETPEIIKSPELSPFAAFPLTNNDIIENENNISNLLEKTTPPLEIPEKTPSYRHRGRLSRVKNPINEDNFESPTIIRKNSNRLLHNSMNYPSENYRSNNNRPVLKSVSHMSANSNKFNHERNKLNGEEEKNESDDEGITENLESKSEVFDVNKRRGYYSRFKNKAMIH